MLVILYKLLFFKRHMLLITKAKFPWGQDWGGGGQLAQFPHGSIGQCQGPGNPFHVSRMDGRGPDI